MATSKLLRNNMRVFESTESCQVCSEAKLSFCFAKGGVTSPVSLNGWQGLGDVVVVVAGADAGAGGEHTHSITESDAMPLWGPQFLHSPSF